MNINTLNYTFFGYGLKTMALWLGFLVWAALDIIDILNWKSKKSVIFFSTQPLSGFLT